MSPKTIIKNGIYSENPIFAQAIGICPVLAVTTSTIDAIGMGLTFAVVILFTNLFISFIRHIVTPKIRIPIYVAVIASIVTIVRFFLEAYLPELNASLGIFIPLIVVNCIVIARAETFASKNGPITAMIDAVAMGIGFTLALAFVGVIREILGAGTVLGMALPVSFPETLIMLMAPGAFFTLGFLMILYNCIKNRKTKEARI